MKLSTLIKSMTQILFWMSLMLLLTLFTPMPHPIIWYPLSIGVVWVLLFFIRKYRIMYFPALSHIVVTAVVAGIQTFLGIMSWPMNAAFAILILLSMIAGIRDSEFILDANPAQVVLFTLVLLIAYVGDFGYLGIFLAFYAAFLFGYFYGTVQTNYEDEIYRLNRFSHVDKKTLTRQSLLPPLLACLILFGSCLGISTLGLLPVFTKTNLAVKGALRNAYDYVVSGITRQPEGGLPEVEQGGMPLGPETVETTGKTDWSAMIAAIVFLVFLVGMVVWAVISRLRQPRTKEELPEGYEQTILVDAKSKAVPARKKKAADDTIRRRMRRIYAKRIRQKRGARNDDLIARTPKEHQAIKEKEGIYIAQNFVDFYEKARYSEDILTREDIKNMIKEPDRIANNQPAGYGDE